MDVFFSFHGFVIENQIKGQMTKNIKTDFIPFIFSILSKLFGIKLNKFDSFVFSIQGFLIYHCYERNLAKKAIEDGKQ